MSMRGFNLGGWLLMEGYILGGRNIPVKEFRRKFSALYGAHELDRFDRSFRARFIQEQDIVRISRWGANCLRVPFHYRLIERKPYTYDRNGMSLLRQVVRWAGRCKMKVILDLHAACGSQNHDWHSDSSGDAFFWSKKNMRQRMCRLWGYIADFFHDDDTIYGYDILNEPVLAQHDEGILADFYRNAIRSIRECDQRHFIFLEGSNWAQRLEVLDSFVGQDILPSIHFYEPLDCTFAFVPGACYPGKINGSMWDKNTLRRKIETYAAFARKHRTRIFVGEFGVNYRGGVSGELCWLHDVVSLFEEYKFDWTYWTYKAVAQKTFPDGVMQYCKNPGWVRREGPLYGWENFYTLWGSEKEKIQRSWDTDAFLENTELVAVLNRYLCR